MNQPFDPETDAIPVVADVAVGASAPEQPFRRVHPLTPLLRFWTLILAVLAGLAFNINASSWAAIWAFISGDRSTAIWQFLLSVGLFILVCGLIWLLSRIWWKANGFRLTAEEIQHRRGVFNTQLRTARFDRIQAVDLVESVIARIFRVASVRVETAGGNNSVIEIAFLKRAEAEDLRRELIATTQGRRDIRPEGAEDTADTADTAPAAGPADPAGPAVIGEHHGVGGEQHVVVPSIPIQRTLASAALSLSTIVTVVGLLIILLTPLGLPALLPFLLGVAPSVWNLIDKSWTFQAVLNGDVLNVSYGLADRRRQSIPLDRIHGVSLTQPLLWRLCGWWTVSVSVAGYGAETNNGGTTKLLPVGSKELALQLLEVVGPLDNSQLAESADPAQITRPNYTSPDAAKWVSPLDRKQQGVTLVGHTADAPESVIVHFGRLYHRMAVIDVRHIQELTLKRGPIQRILGLSTVQLDLVPGPVAMEGRDLTYAHGMELINVLRRRQLPELTGPVAGPAGTPPDA